MSHCIETIKVENKIFYQLTLHSERMNRTRKELYSCEDLINLKSILKIPPQMDYSPWKCRIVYDEQIRDITFEKYVPRTVRVLQLVDVEDIDYTYKYQDRDRLNELRSNGLADDILIVKNGKITDVSFANIIFYDGQQWVTSDTPLLKGVMREYMLRKDMLMERSISVFDLKNYKSAKLINVMLDPDDSPLIEMTNIRYFNQNK